MTFEKIFECIPESNIFDVNIDKFILQTQMHITRYFSSGTQLVHFKLFCPALTENKASKTGWLTVMSLAYDVSACRD